MYVPPVNDIARNHWKPVPFLRLGIPFVAGISAAHFLPVFPLANYLLFILVLLWIIAEFIPISRSIHLGLFRGALLLFVVFLTGFIRTTPLLQPAKTPLSGQDVQELALVLEQPFQPTIKGFKTIAGKFFIATNGRFTRLPGKILVYADTSFKSRITTGTVLLTRTKLLSLPKAMNPGTFDAAAYYHKKQIIYRCHLTRQSTRMAHNNRGTFISRMVEQLEQKCLKIFEQFIEGKQERAIAAALLIGYKLELPAELINAYRNTGIIHIIAISGMHMALLFGLLHKIVAPLRKRKWLSHLVPLLLLVAAWLFTLLTGASPSIVRAALVATLLVLGEWWQKENNTYNSVAATAVLLLIYNPHYITDAGFQLSFAAVTGILLFSKTIALQWKGSNKIITSVIELLAVTLAAQLLTLPLLLFHFHRFPLLFLFTNLIAVPLSTGILYLEIVLLAVQPFPALAEITGTIIEHSIRWMNQWAVNTAQIPGTSINGVYLNWGQTLLLLAGSFVLAQSFTRRNRHLFLAGIICLFLVAGIGSIRQFSIQRQHLLIVYQIPRKTAIHLLEADRQWLLTNGSGEETAWTDQIMQTAEWYWGARQQKKLQQTLINYPLIRSRNKQILLIDGRNYTPSMILPPKADWVILMRNAKVSLESLQTRLDCTQFVIDGSNQMWKIREWKKEAAQLHLQCHSTTEQGAFIINL